MTDEKITLTPLELEEIKDVVRFREKTTLSFKTLFNKIDGVCTTITAIDKDVIDIDKDVIALKTHRNIQWFILGCIVIGIISGAIYIIKRGL